jgi:hypothetical protein
MHVLKKTPAIRRLSDRRCGEDPILQLRGMTDCVPAKDEQNYERIACSTVAAIGISESILVNAKSFRTLGLTPTATTRIPLFLQLM